MLSARTETVSSDDADLKTSSLVIVFVSPLSSMLSAWIESVESDDADLKTSSLVAVDFKPTRINVELMICVDVDEKSLVNKTPFSQFSIFYYISILFFMY